MYATLTRHEILSWNPSNLRRNADCLKASKSLLRMASPFGEYAFDAKRRIIPWKVHTVRVYSKCHSHCIVLTASRTMAYAKSPNFGLAIEVGTSRPCRIHCTGMSCPSWQYRTGSRCRVSNSNPTGGALVV